MKAITELRRTGWFISDDTGTHMDDLGNMWFSKEVAMDLGRKLGIIPHPVTSGGLKNVVTGYEIGAEDYQ